MNNFYDDCFDMVPYEKPNLAVQQLAVNENGDVTVEGSLSTTGSLVTKKSMDVQSVDGMSLIKMRGSGHPSTGDADVQIACVNGDSNHAYYGKMVVAAAGGVTLDIPIGDLDINSNNVYMRSNLFIDARGTTESNIYIYGAGGGFAGNATSSPRIQLQVVVVLHRMLEI